MSTSASNHVVVFRTGQLIEIDMTVAALQDAGVPHFTREETSSGLRLAMPVAPATYPGVWWSLVVPREREEEAREILLHFPFAEKTDPDVWDFKPREPVKRGWKIYLALTLIGWFVFGLFYYGR